MDTLDYITEQHKWQHLLVEERHVIEARVKDEGAVYQITKRLGRAHQK